VSCLVVIWANEGAGGATHRSACNLGQCNTEQACTKQQEDRMRVCARLPSHVRTHANKLILFVLTAHAHTCPVRPSAFSTTKDAARTTISGVHAASAPRSASAMP